MDQLSIFEELYPKYKITKPIRLIELFAGYGSQAFALEYLGVPFEHWKIAEWNYKSFDAYNRFHIADNTDYSKGKNREWLNNYILEKGVSADWNKPMTDKQVKKLPDHKARKIYNDIIATHNMVNIQSIKGKDLEIKDNEHTYILCYSFPCQDLSLAGKTAGMKRDSGTRSGLLWEVERVLKECKELGKLPNVLLMENVPQVHGADNMDSFREWMLELEKLGYSNYWQDLIATDYGIPQIRNRCFMVSILGEWFYDFPKPETLKIRLKDLLEKEAKEKYYLSDEKISWMIAYTDEQRKKGNNFKFIPTDGNGIAKTITTTNATRIEDNFIKEKQAGITKSLRETIAYNEIPDRDVCFIDAYNRAIRNDDIAGTITCHVNQATSYVSIKNATKRGYLEAYEGDGIDLSAKRGNHRGTVQQNKSQTITTMGGVGVMENSMDNIRIRRLTPKECFRLMGVKDKNYEKLDGFTDGDKYHLAGDSIVVNVLMAIFKEML